MSRIASCSKIYDKICYKNGKKSSKKVTNLAKRANLQKSQRGLFLTCNMKEMLASIAKIQFGLQETA